MKRDVNCAHKLLNGGCKLPVSARWFVHLESMNYSHRSVCWLSVCLRSLPCSFRLLWRNTTQPKLRRGTRSLLVTPRHQTSAAWCLPRVSSANGTLRMTLKPFFFFFQLKQLIVQRGAIRAAQWSLGLKRLKPSSVNLCLIHTKLVAWESDSCEAFWVRSSVSVHVVTIATASRSLTMRVLDILQEEKGIGGTMSFFILFFFVWSIKLITSCLREPWRRTSSPLCDTWSSADVQKLHHRCLLIWWQYFSQLLLF